MTESRPPYRAPGDEAKSPDTDRYLAGTFDANGYDADGYNQFGYDANGLDRWGVTLERKERAFAKLARRFEDQPDSMAALLLEYRKQEGITLESLLARLEITPAQYAHLALCYVPDAEENFQTDMLKMVAASGANLLELATICRQVYALREIPKRPPVVGGAQTEPSGSPVRANTFRAMAARDRQAKALREEGVDYAADVNAAAATPAPLPPTIAPKPEGAAGGSDVGDTTSRGGNKEDDDSPKDE